MGGVIEMSMVDIEMIVNGSIAFNKTIEHDIVQLMMSSDYITVNSSTVKVYTTEVTDKGVVKFFGVKGYPEEEMFR